MDILPLHWRKVLCPIDKSVRMQRPVYPHDSPQGRWRPAVPLPCSPALLCPTWSQAPPSPALCFGCTPLGNIQVTDKGKEEQQGAELRPTLLLHSSKCQASIFQHHHVLHSLLG